jgi:hypothetical protein
MSPNSVLRFIATKIRGEEGNILFLTIINVYVKVPHHKKQHRLVLWITRKIFGKLELWKNGYLLIHPIFHFSNIPVLIYPVTNDFEPMQIFLAWFMKFLFVRKLNS